jgi:hypothetical protein
MESRWTCQADAEIPNELSGAPLLTKDDIIMRFYVLIAAVAFATTLTIGSAVAFDDAIYPNLKGQWTELIVPGRSGQVSFDQTKSWGPGQQAPLTPEYQRILADSMADQAKGGQGNFHGSGCVALGMPQMVVAFQPQEYVVTPETTYVLINALDHIRRIFTDGRDWPKEIEPTYQGYSIGKWLDTDGDGRFDTLEVETRGPFKGPRVFDATGLPLAHDNQSVFKERLFVDKDDPNILHNQITAIDSALTQPWTVDRRYVRSASPRTVWPEFVCGEENAEVRIGKENYFRDADGLLMPARKNQAPPDLRHFKQ